MLKSMKIICSLCVQHRATHASYTSVESLLSLCEPYPRQTESGTAGHSTNQATKLLVTAKRESVSVVLIPAVAVAALAAAAAAATNSEGLRPMLYGGACLLRLKATPLPDVVGG